MSSVRRFCVFFAKSFIVALAFLIDVKVKAEDFKITKSSGQFEIDDSKNSSFKESVSSPCDVETFAYSLLALHSDNLIVNVGENTLFTLDKNLTFFKGQIWVQTKQSLEVKTKHTTFKLESGDYYLTLNHRESAVAVIQGRAQAIDRAKQSTTEVKAGFSTWVGGLTAQGHHTAGDVMAFDLRMVTNAVKRLGVYSEDLQKSKHDTIVVNWQNAVEEGAKKTQSAVFDEMRMVAEYDARAKNEEARTRAEQQRLKKLLRAKVFGEGEEDLN